MKAQLTLTHVIKKKHGRNGEKVLQFNSLTCPIRYELYGVYSVAKCLRYPLRVLEFKLFQSCNLCLMALLWNQFLRAFYVVIVVIFAAVGFYFSTFSTLLEDTQDHGIITTSDKCAISYFFQLSYAPKTGQWTHTHTIRLNIAANHCLMAWSQCTRPFYRQLQRQIDNQQHIFILHYSLRPIDHNHAALFFFF